MKKFCAIIFLICIFTLSGCAHEHTWEDANCIAPKTCCECNETEGEALGHTWKDATCTAPKTCSVCNETKGEKLAHIWVDATCTAPQICSNCNETEGEALGHTWKDATCTAPQICSNCNETEGEALGHTSGEWIAEDPDYSTVCYFLKQYCSICDTYLDSEIVFFDTMHKNGLFLFSPEEFSERLESYYSVLKAGMTTELAVLDDNTLGCGIIYKGDCIAVIMFNDNTSSMEGEGKDSHTMSSMMVKYFTDDVSIVAKSMYGIMFACEPSLEESDAKQLARYIVYAAEENNYYEYKGIKYLLRVQGNAYWFFVSVLEK